MRNLPLWTFGFKTKVTKDITKTTHSVVSTTDSDIVVSKISKTEIISKTVPESELPIFKSALDWPLDYLVEENRVDTADDKVTVQRDSNVQKDAKLVSPVLSPSLSELTTPATVTDNSAPIADGMLSSKPYTLERHVRFNKTHEVLTLTRGENDKIDLVVGVNYEPPTIEAVSADIIINSPNISDSGRKSVKIGNYNVYEEDLYYEEYETVLEPLVVPARDITDNKTGIRHTSDSEINAVQESNYPVRPPNYSAGSHNVSNHIIEKFANNSAQTFLSITSG
jgi:hypothetical protein